MDAIDRRSALRSLLCGVVAAGLGAGLVANPVAAITSQAWMLQACNQTKVIVLCVTCGRGLELVSYQTMVRQMCRTKEPKRLLRLA